MRKTAGYGAAALTAAAIVSGEVGASGAVPVEGFDSAYASITRAELARHIETLASDAFEGREPGTEGERKTIEYLRAAFAAAGAAPGVGGSYFQEVPLLEMRRDRDPILELVHGGKSERLKLNRDFVAFAGGATAAVSITAADLVFVGYGITAPEQGWDDYAGVDVRGKVVVALRGEPSRTDNAPGFFKGVELTRHGIQPSKYETAAAHGARGVILIHTDKSAGYPWSVLTGGGVGSAQQFIDDGTAKPKLEIVVHVPEGVGDRLLKASSQGLDEATRRANTPGFRAFALPQRATAGYVSRVRKIRSKNVVAMIRGSSAPEECVVYTAHWDHIGRNDQLKGDQIFNGAVDNATGTSALIELAQAYAKLPRAPRRSVIFIATTAEEKGLLGAEYHADHPVCALPKTAAVLNLDAHFPFGAFDAMTVPGLGASEVETVLAKAAARLGRVLQPDSEPQAGAYYRSDHYPFAKRGVPAIFAVGTPRDTVSENDPVMKRFVDYVTTKYHKVTDEYDAATWDLRGVEDDVKVYFETGLTIANDTRFPNWFDGNEFRSIRDVMRAGG